MTKVPQGFDFSFLNDEEARKILRVLERNEELQRAEKERISKLQKTKRDIRWLQGVTGEWFEEIQRKKFCNETDVSQMLKPPLTYRLRKGMAENDQTSRSQNLPNQRNPTSVASRLSFRSSFASLFSFRKSRKETLKLQSLAPRGCVDQAGPPAFVKGAAMQTKLHKSSLENQPVGSAFVPRPTDMREGGGLSPWDASLLENEFFRVLDDLDSKLAQEQVSSSAVTRTPLHYGSKTSFNHFYSSGNRQGNVPGWHKNRYNETSNMSIYDILRPGTPREGFKTFSPRTRTIYDMYRTREPQVLKEDYVGKNTFGSTSLCLDSRQRSALPAMGPFTARSLHFPGTAQNKSGFTAPNHQQSPKRIPLSSIIWNRSDSSRERQNQEEFPTAPSPMEIDPADQFLSPRCFQESARYDFYHSQSVYQSVNLNAPMDNAMHSDPLENSENMPFYHQGNPFAKSFFSNTFGRSREQGHFWGQKEKHSSWSDFNQMRKTFSSSDKDFEMTSMEVSSVPVSHSYRGLSPHWGSFSHSYRKNISRDQEESHSWQFNSQPPTLENMEVSQDNGNEPSLHFGAPNIGSMAGSSYQIKSGGLECQQDSALIEKRQNKDTYSFGSASSLASSSRSSLPQISNDQRNPRSPSFQNPTVTVQKTTPDQPIFLPVRGYTEVTVTSSNPVDYPSFIESQPKILVTEVSNNKELNDFALQKEKQFNKMNQTNMANEILQSASQTVISSPLPDFQNPLSQDSAKSNRFVFNASTTINSKESPRVNSRKDNSKMYTPSSDKAGKLIKDTSCAGNRKLGLATSFPLLQDNRTSSFPRPNQGHHQELTANHEAIPSPIQNNNWGSEPTDNQNVEHSERHSVLDTKEERCITTTNSSKPATHHGISCDSLGLSRSLSDSLPVNNSFPDSLVSSPTTVFSRSLSGPDPSLREREERDNDSKNLNSQFSPNPSENRKSNDGRVSAPNEGAGVVKYQSHLSLRDGKGKGTVRERVSYIEKLSQTESRPMPPRSSHSQIKWNQRSNKVFDFHSTYCTLPRKSPSTLINTRKTESKVVTSSLRHEPLPFPVRENVKDVRERRTPNKLSPSSSESEDKSSKVLSDLVPAAPEATEKMVDTSIPGSASVRKRPLPCLMQRAVSCPSGTHASGGREYLGSDTYASTITPRPWERTTNSLESVSSVRDHSLPKRSHQKEDFKETEKGRQFAASRVSVIPLSKEDPLPFTSDLSGKESGDMLHKLKTTSMFSVSGDEDNVKCFEMVSVYYTLPRNQSKKICNFLQKCPPKTGPLAESSQVGTEALSDALEKVKLDSSALEQAGTLSSEELKVPVNTAQNGHVSPTMERGAAPQSPGNSSPEPTFQVLVSTEAETSLDKGEPKTKQSSPCNLAKTLGDSQSRKVRGRKVQSETLPWRKTKSDDSSLHPPAHSGEETESSHVLQRAGECAGTDFQNMTAKDTESQVSALAPVLQKLRLDSVKPNLEKSQSESRELPQRSQEVSLSENRESGDGPQRLAWNQLLLPGGNNTNKTDWGDLGKGKIRSSVKHRLAAMSKASRKSPAKDSASPRRHIATIFSQSGNSSGFNSLPLGTSQGKPLSPELPPKSTEPTDESRLSNSRKDVENSANSLEGRGVPSREAVSHSRHPKSNSISQPHQDEFENISKSTPTYEPSKGGTTAHSWELDSDALTQQPALSSLREANFTDHQRRLDLTFPQEPAQKSTISFPPAGCPQLGVSTEPLAWEAGPPSYHSKSLKNIHLHGDLQRMSQPPKGRERHFSENTSIDHALNRLALGDELPVDGVYSRRFKSFSEFPSCDDSEGWVLRSRRTKTDPRSVSSISRPIDYGIFGKEQQLAFLENVKRSLTQGRLWKPSFLKNPGFLKDSVSNLSNPEESLNSSSPDNPTPADGVSPSAPLDIYEDDVGDSDCDTDTTTDDEYYLDENDKESEL